MPLHGLTHCHINFVSQHTVSAIALNAHVACSVPDCTTVEERITSKIDDLLAYGRETILSSGCLLAKPVNTVPPTPSGLEVRVCTIFFRHNEVSAWILAHADPIQGLLVHTLPFSLQIGVSMITPNGKRVANTDRGFSRQLFRHGPRLRLPSSPRPFSCFFQLKIQQQVV